MNSMRTTKNERMPPELNRIEPQRRIIFFYILFHFFKNWFLGFYFFTCSGRVRPLHGRRVGRDARPADRRGAGAAPGGRRVAWRRLRLAEAASQQRQRVLKTKHGKKNELTAILFSFQQPISTTSSLIGFSFVFVNFFSSGFHCVGSISID